MFLIPGLLRSVVGFDLSIPITSYPCFLKDLHKIDPIKPAEPVIPIVPLEKKKGSCLKTLPVEANLESDEDMFLSI